MKNSIYLSTLILLFATASQIQADQTQDSSSEAFTQKRGMCLNGFRVGDALGLTAPQLIHSVEAQRVDSAGSTSNAFCRFTGESDYSGAEIRITRIEQVKEADFVKHGFEKTHYYIYGSLTGVLEASASNMPAENETALAECKNGEVIKVRSDRLSVLRFVGRFKSIKRLFSRAAECEDPKYDIARVGMSGEKTKRLTVVEGTKKTKKPSIERPLAQRRPASIISPGALMPNPVEPDQANPEISEK